MNPPSSNLLSTATMLYESDPGVWEVLNAIPKFEFSKVSPFYF